MSPFQFTHAGTTYHVVVDQRSTGFTMSSEGVGVQYYTAEEYCAMRDSLFTDREFFIAFRKAYEAAEELG